MGRCSICAKEFSAQEYGGRFQANSQLQSHMMVTHPGYFRFMRVWNRVVALPLAGIAAAVIVIARLMVFGAVLLTVSIVASLLGVWYRSRKISTYKREWTGRLVPVSSTDPSVAPERPIASDESILQATSSLSQLLNIAPANPTRVQWIDYIMMGRGGNIRVEADKPMVGGKVITLPLRFKDQLTTDEWRPLISSMLITRAWQRTKRLWSILLVVAIAVGVNAAVYFLLSPPPSAEPIIVLLIVLVSFPAVGMGLSPLLKKELLEADKQTATTPETNNLLQVLQRLEASGEDQSRPRTSPYGKPSIKQRIENLQTYSQTRV